MKHTPHQTEAHTKVHGQLRHLSGVAWLHSI